MFITKEYFTLFLTFARIGAFTFGGGYAMLPLLQREVVEKKGWATEEELMDYYAIGQCTPGVIAVNTSTFIGFKQKGILGAIFATLGMITPSLIIILALAAFFNHFADLPIIQHAFNGIRVAVCATVVVSIYKLARKGIVDIVTVVLFLAAFCVMVFLHVSSIYIVVGAALIGILARILQRNLKAKGGRGQ
ncbi:MAG: chromate transporter [Oscillospiraceae bacterium]|nr:chromate transporter [Oscillospiraceae bacterium]